MDEMTVVVSAIALMFGAGWASGINLYAAMLAIGIMGNSGLFRARIILEPRSTAKTN